MREQYLCLLKKALTFTLYEYIDRQWPPPKEAVDAVSIKRPTATERSERINGKDWPTIGETMIGIARMNNLQKCVEDVLECHIEGDLIEAGVWRGGASIFMRGILSAYGSDKKVYLADSFKGLPAPNMEKYPIDRDMNLHNFDTLRCSKKQVMSNFERYGLLDEKVEFIEGWFKDTLGALKDKKWAVIRLDGDMYESTIQSLEALYPNLQRGGYCIIDDYMCIRQCRNAVNDYREKHGITEKMEQVDWAGIFFRKE